MDKVKTPSEEQVRSEFLALKPELEKWGKTVDEILNAHLKVAFASIEHVQREACYRVKEIESYCQKVLLRKPSANPILETTDKVGTRVVLLTSHDVEQISQFVIGCEKWCVKEQSRDYLDEIFHDPSVFGYQSNHFIVQPLQEYETEADRNLLTCEIQVRTILQHAYAEISHDTVYKKSSVDNPKAKRMLASSMAMLEAADEKFNQIYAEINSMDNFYYRFQTNLTDIYKSFVPDYKADDYNTDLAMKLMKIYTKQEQVEIFEKLPDFVAGEKDRIGEQITFYKGKSVLFTQPIVLVALYGISELQTKTWVSWPLSYDSIVDVITAMDYSIDSFK